MDEFPFSALFLFAQSCLTDAVNVIFSDYCFTDTYLRGCAGFCAEGSVPPPLPPPRGGPERTGRTGSLRADWKKTGYFIPQIKNFI